MERPIIAILVGIVVGIITAAIVTQTQVHPGWSTLVGIGTGIGAAAGIYIADPTKSE